MTHTRAEIAEFTGTGEGRFVYAAWRTHPERPLFYMEDGQAAVVKDMAKAELRCLISDCDTPDLTTYHSSVRRDHFKHLRKSGVSHAGESVLHLQGKAMVAAWLRRHGGRVVVEQAIDTQQHPGVADVMYFAPEGWQVAFEVQYSSLTVEEWQTRHQRYVDAGIQDVWLWGHTGANMAKTAGKHGPPIKLNAVQQAVVAAGMPVWWINPELGTVGIAVTDFATTRHRNASILGNFGRYPYIDTIVDQRILTFAEESPAGIRIGPLEELWPTIAGIGGPITDLLADGAQRVAAWKHEQAELWAKERAARAAREQKAEEARAEQRKRTLLVALAPQLIDLTDTEVDQRGQTALEDAGFHPEPNDLSRLRSDVRSHRMKRDWQKLTEDMRELLNQVRERGHLITEDTYRTLIDAEYVRRGRGPADGREAYAALRVIRDRADRIEREARAAEEAASITEQHVVVDPVERVRYEAAYEQVHYGDALGSEGEITAAFAAAGIPDPHELDISYLVRQHAYRQELIARGYQPATQPPTGPDWNAAPVCSGCLSTLDPARALASRYHATCGPRGPRARWTAAAT